MTEARVEVPLAQAGLAASLTAAAGMAVFGLLVHRDLPWLAGAFAGLVLAAVAISRSPEWADWRRALALLGLGGEGQAVPVHVLARGCLAGLVLGGGAALLVRRDAGLGWMPALSCTPFVVSACLIGAAEELLYRGWMQGRLASLGAPAAVLLAAFAHAAYKTALFALPPGDVSPAGYPLPTLFALTLAGGCVFGALRQLTRSLLPPLCAHAAFDLVLYGAFAEAPWWVWD